MNTEQIIKMGYEAGLCDEKGAGDNSIYFDTYLADLTRFAELVAAAEREACAKVCDEHGFYGASPAADIRARGTT